MRDFCRTTCGHEASHAYWDKHLAGKMTLKLASEVVQLTIGLDARSVPTGGFFDDAQVRWNKAKAQPRRTDDHLRLTDAGANPGGLSRGGGPAERGDVHTLVAAVTNWRRSGDLARKASIQLATATFAVWIADPDRRRRRSGWTSNKAPG